MAIILDGKKVSITIQDELAEEIKKRDLIALICHLRIALLVWLS